MVFSCTLLGFFVGRNHAPGEQLRQNGLNITLDLEVNDRLEQFIRIPLLPGVRRFRIIVFRLFQQQAHRLVVEAGSFFGPLNMQVTLRSSEVEGELRSN